MATRDELFESIAALTKDHPSWIRGTAGGPGFFISPVYPDETWICSQCGSIHNSNAIKCRQCGATEGIMIKPKGQGEDVS